MRRIHRAKDKEPLIKELTGGDEPLFSQIWKLLLFSAILGYRHGRRVPLSSFDQGKGIDAQIFGNSSAWPGIVHLLALVEVENESALSESKEEEAVKRFEEYANGGLEVLKEEFEAASYDPVKLTTYLLQETSAPVGTMSLEEVEI